MCRCVILLFLLTIQILRADNVLVSIQSQSQTEMELLTEKVDQDIQLSHSSMRQTLGAIEATMSRVVDEDSEYFVAPVLSVPTWSMLKDIEYNMSTDDWTFEYQTMRAEPTTLNQFHRVLYFTKAGMAQHGDIDNQCLQDGISSEDCLSYLQNYYTVSPDFAGQAIDYITYQGTGSDDISTELSGEPSSLTENVKITIPHTRIRNGSLALARQETHVHPILGSQTQWTFGIGMLFWGVGNTMIYFDTFDLIENSFEQLAISRSNSYSLARHVSFWTERVQYDTSIRIAIVEYFLSPGYEIVNISVSLNYEDITPADCSGMTEKVNALADKTCLYAHDLCSPNTLLTGDSGDLISYAIPIPQHHAAGIQVNTLLNIRDVVTDRIIMNTLNFKTDTEPQDVCLAPKTETFDPILNVNVTIYKGHALVAQEIDGTFTVQNVSDNALGLPEALMTLVLSPKDEKADTYFADFPDEVIQLDELYITHAIQGSTAIPETPINNVTGVHDTHEGVLMTGRSQLELDRRLLQNCPLEYAWDASLECVTTQDWTLTGQHPRSFSSGNTYFVRRATFTVDDVSWLQSHSIFMDSSFAWSFLHQIQALVPSETRRGKSAFYFIFPVYEWPDKSPIGLKDKALVSFSWSVSKTSMTSRRLLEVRRTRPRGKEKPTTASKFKFQRVNKMPRIQLDTTKQKKQNTKSLHGPSKSFELMRKTRALF